MSNYGFKDKAVAIRLKNSISAGAASASNVGGWGGGDEASVDIFNSSGMEIPPYGIVFPKPTTNAERFGGQPVVEVWSFRQALMEEENNGGPKGALETPLFNGPQALEPDTIGTAENIGNGFSIGMKKSNYPYDFMTRVGCTTREADFTLDRVINQSGPSFYFISMLDGGTLGVSENYRPMMVRRVPGGESETNCLGIYD